MIFHPAVQPLQPASPLAWCLAFVDGQLLLPDLDGVDSVEEQVHIARQKAGIRDDEPVKLQRFKVTRHY